MKKLFAALIFVAFVTSLSAQKNPFEQFTDMDGVTSVFISKNMLSLFPKNAKNMNYGGIDVSSFLNKLSSILILTTENENIGRGMVSLANSQVKSNKYELLMRVKSDDNDNVNFYMKGNPSNISELIMIVDGSDNESVIMQFLGNFTLQDIQKMTEGFGKK
jgi:hypothetical protein